MPLPPADHPARPVFLASHSMFLLGILTLLLGSCTSFYSVFAVLQAGRYATGSTPNYGPPTTAQYLYAAAFFMVLLTVAIIATGTTLLVCARQILQRKRWAITTGLVIGCLLGGLAMVSLLLNLLAIATDASRRTPGGIVATCLLCAIVALCAQLVVHLSKSYRGIEMMRGLPVDLPGSIVEAQRPPQQ